MSRALITLKSTADRERAAHWARHVPWGTRIEFKETKRTLPQNSRFWAMLTDISTQVKHGGVHYPPDIWKALMMQAWGREVKWIPALDGQGVVPVMFSSSDLSKGEMADLMEFMAAWGAEHGVNFGESGDENQNKARPDQDTQAQ